jgi:cell division protein FtsZ
MRPQATHEQGVAVVEQVVRGERGGGAADRARARAATVSWSDPQLALVRARVDGAFAGWMRTPRMDFPGTRRTWTANRIRSEVDPDANIIFGNTILDDMEGRIRVSVVATGIDADQMRMPLPEKVRTLHPHLNLKSPARIADPVPPFGSKAPAYAPMPAAATAATLNPVHATMNALAQEIGADKSPAEDYILGGTDAPEIMEEVVKYPATETYRPLETQPLAQAPAEKKSGWGFFGRKKTQDLRAEPAPEPRMAAPAQQRATATPMPQPQSEAPRAKDDDLFPDHKCDEQFEIPAFLRRQSS